MIWSYTEQRSQLSQYCFCHWYNIVTQVLFQVHVNVGEVTLIRMVRLLSFLTVETSDYVTFSKINFWRFNRPPSAPHICSWVKIKPHVGRISVNGQPLRKMRTDHSPARPWNWRRIHHAVNTVRMRWPIDLHVHSPFRWGGKFRRLALRRRSQLSATVLLYWAAYPSRSCVQDVQLKIKQWRLLTRTFRSGSHLHP